MTAYYLHCYGITKEFVKGGHLLYGPFNSESVALKLKTETRHGEHYDIVELPCETVEQAAEYYGKYHKETHTLVDDQGQFTTSLNELSINVIPLGSLEGVLPFNVLSHEFFGPPPKLLPWYKRWFWFLC